jgi:hypothetical protein
VEKLIGKRLGGVIGRAKALRQIIRASVIAHLRRRPVDMDDGSAEKLPDQARQGGMLTFAHRPTGIVTSNGLGY